MRLRRISGFWILDHVENFEQLARFFSGLELVALVVGVCVCVNGAHIL